MKLKTRLLIISQIGFEFCNQHGRNSSDGYWLIGMLSDLTLKGKALQKEIDKVKKEFPHYGKFFP